MSDVPEKYHYDLFLGQFTKAWAQAEYLIDVTIGLIIYRHNGNSIEKRIPNGLEAKIRFLNLAFERLSSLKPFAPDGLAIIADLEAIKEDRHFLIHGIAAEVSSDLERTLRKIRIFKEMFGGPEKRFTNKDILNLTRQAQALNLRLLPLAYGLLGVAENKP